MGQFTTNDIYLIPYDKSIPLIGYDTTLEDEIVDTLMRIENDTYEYVGEVKLKVHLSFWERYSNNGH